jgi:hypothetical protein
MKKILLLIIVTFSTSSYSQWSYKSSKSDFDGSYKTSSVYGTGGKFPYTKPYLVVNKFENRSVNIYFSDAGYSGCDGRKVFFKFEGDEVIYETSYVGNGAGNDSWFISSFKNTTQYQFIHRLKNSSLLSVRIRSDCGSVDYKFGLRGSTKALNFVLGEKWGEDKNKEILELKVLEEKKRKEDIISNSLWIKKLEKKRKEKLRVKEEKKEKEKEQLLKCKKLFNNYSGKGYDCYEVITSTMLREQMQNMDLGLKVNKGELLLIDKKFKNKVFYKVVDLEGTRAVNLYVFKNKIRSIYKM